MCMQLYFAIPGIELKCVQYRITHILGSLAGEFELSRLIVSHNNGLQLCIQSLLQEKVAVEEYIVSIEDLDTELLVESIVGALGLLNK